MDFRRVEKQDWALLAKNANVAVFGELVEPHEERIDFAYLIFQSEQLIGFASCQERDAKTLHVQYGGLVKQKQNQGIGRDLFGGFLAEIRLNYERVTMLVENTNLPMLKLALEGGLFVIGVRFFKGATLVELGREF